MLRTFIGLPRMIKAIDALARQADVVTFDMFDTLLIRRVPDPNTVKLPVARYIAERASAMGLACSCSDALRMRHEAETRHRARNGALHPDHEARYPEFMREALAEVFPEPVLDDILADVTRYELAVENSVIVPRAAWPDLLSRLRAAGKQVWVLSDIYLPSEHLKVLLKHAGLLDLLHGVYSSADALRAKASGAGFKLMQERHGWAPERWLHVGDNPISDGVRPHELGITACVLRDAGEAYRKKTCRVIEHSARERPFWKGRLVQQLMLPLEAENQAVHPLYVMGYNFFGPLLASFIHRLAERTHELGVPRIYFLAREGYMFQRAWELMLPWLFPAGNAPESRYLLVSRRALGPSACAHHGLSVSSAHIAMLPAKNRDFRDIARIYRLDLDALQPHLKRFELDRDTPLHSIYPGWSMDIWRRFYALLGDDLFRKEVMRQTAGYGLRVERYLEQEGFFEHEHVAVVDMGWLGTIQRYLYESIDHRADAPTIHGFLLGASRGIPFPTSAENSVEGLLYDALRFDFAASSITYALDVFEEACRGPHGGLDDYIEQQGKVAPVLKHDDEPDRVLERKQDAYYAPLREGMLAAVERYASAVALLGLKFQDVQPWINHILLGRLAFPRPWELRHLRFLHHADDFSGNNPPPINIRLRQTRLWDLPPACMWLPGLRLAYYLDRAAGLPLRQTLARRWISIKQQLTRKSRFSEERK